MVGGETDAQATKGREAVRTLRRRGLIAGAAALALGTAVAGERQVAAATGGSFIIGQVNIPSSSADSTRLVNPSTSLSPSMFSVANYGLTAGSFPSNSRIAVAGYTNAAGTTGTGDTSAQVIGVYGQVGGSSSTLSAGVYGTTIDNGSGVLGTYGNGAPAPYLNGGVAGTAPTGGVGVSGTANGSGGYAVFGRSDSGSALYGSSMSGRGVYGVSGSGFGVYGQSTGSIGVFGQAPLYGVVGNATSAGGYGIYGLATADGTSGFAGGTTNASAFAAVFGGRVVINDGGPGVPGGLIVNGSLGITGTKSAIVPDGSGGHRLMYCVEAPESWFEDFGEGTLMGGKAEVKLAADFASTVDSSTLHVFLTPHDEAHHLAVKARSSTGFSVAADPSGPATARGMKAGDLNGTFTYRVVAKRKDVAAPRLAKFELPAVKLTFPTLPPPVPMPEKKPDNVGPVPPLVPAPGGKAKP